jgi:CheY-like chemotaxis protein
MKQRILVVEDDLINRQVLTSWLKKIGDFEIQEAANGKEALEMVVAGAPDCILMDLKMPLLDGWEATRQIRARENGEHVPVIAITAQALAGDEGRALAAGCDAYITKPVRDYRDLAAKIAVLLSRGDTGMSDVSPSSEAV